MVLQLTVADVMTQPVLSVSPETALQDAVQLISDHHISGLPVVDGEGALVGELSEQDLMVRESGVEAGPYVMLLDSVIYLRNPLNWDKQVHQELSLRGPFGGVHNLDVRGDINGDPVQTLKVGDYVEFRAIKPIAIAVRALN